MADIAHKFGLNSSFGIPAGASQTGNFTAAVATKYVCNFSAPATITLPPAASVGDVIVLALGGFQLITLDPNGLKINASTGTLIYGPSRETLILTYTGTAEGWV